MQELMMTQSPVVQTCNYRTVVVATIPVQINRRVHLRQDPLEHGWCLLLLFWDWSKVDGSSCLRCWQCCRSQRRCQSHRITDYIQPEQMLGTGSLAGAKEWGLASWLHNCLENYWHFGVNLHSRTPTYTRTLSKRFPTSVNASKTQ